MPRLWAPGDPAPERGAPSHTESCTRAASRPRILSLLVSAPFTEMRQRPPASRDLSADGRQEAGRTPKLPARGSALVEVLLQCHRGHPPPPAHCGLKGTD